MKSEKSLSDLKKQKNMQNFLKKSSQIELDFFIINFPMRPELVFLLPFVYQEEKIDLFCDVKCNFEKKIWKYVNST